MQTATALAAQAAGTSAHPTAKITAYSTAQLLLPLTAPTAWGNKNSTLIYEQQTHGFMAWLS